MRGGIKLRIERMFGLVFSTVLAIILLAMPGAPETAVTWSQLRQLGEIPELGAEFIVQDGTHLIVDESASQIGTLVVFGLLSLHPSATAPDIQFQVGSIVILGGRLEVVVSNPAYSAEIVLGAILALGSGTDLRQHVGYPSTAVVDGALYASGVDASEPISVPHGTFLSLGDVIMRGATSDMTWGSIVSMDRSAKTVLSDAILEVQAGLPMLLAGPAWDAKTGATLV